MTSVVGVGGADGALDGTDAVDGVGALGGDGLATGTGGELGLSQARITRGARVSAVNRWARIDMGDF
jgi:hypothetical protein